MSSSIGESVPLPPPNSRPDKEPRKRGERFASYIGTTTFRSCSIAGMPTLGTLASNKGFSWQKWISPRYTQSFPVVWGDANRTLLCSYELYGACGDVFLLLPQWQLGLKFFRSMSQRFIFEVIGIWKSWTLLKQPSLPSHQLQQWEASLEDGCPGVLKKPPDWALLVLLDLTLKKINATPGGLEAQEKGESILWRASGKVFKSWSQRSR